jgi:hypothetical protein
MTRKAVMKMSADELERRATRVRALEREEKERQEVHSSLLTYMETEIRTTVDQISEIPGLFKPSQKTAFEQKFDIGEGELHVIWSFKYTKYKD